MLLINHTTKSQPATIGVTDIEGKNVMVWPGDSVEVADVDAVTILTCYSHIFKRVEVVDGNVETKIIINNLKEQLKERDLLIQQLNEQLNATQPVEQSPEVTEEIKEEVKEEKAKDKKVVFKKKK